MVCLLPNLYAMSSFIRPSLSFISTINTWSSSDNVEKHFPKLPFTSETTHRKTAAVGSPVKNLVSLSDCLSFLKLNLSLLGFSTLFPTQSIQLCISSIYFFLQLKYLSLQILYCVTSSIFFHQCDHHQT